MLPPLPPTAVQRSVLNTCISVCLAAAFDFNGACLLWSCCQGHCGIGATPFSLAVPISPIRPCCAHSQIRPPPRCRHPPQAAEAHVQGGGAQGGRADVAAGGVQQVPPCLHDANCAVQESPLAVVVPRSCRPPAPAGTGHEFQRRTPRHAGCCTRIPGSREAVRLLYPPYQCYGTAPPLCPAPPAPAFLLPLLLPLLLVSFVNPLHSSHAGICCPRLPDALHGSLPLCVCHRPALRQQQAMLLVHIQLLVVSPLVRTCPTLPHPRRASRRAASCC